jgi:hypothetical protein
MTAEGARKGRPSRGGGEMVRLLELALAPVEPRAELGDELEKRLAEVREAALGELADWELKAMRDPRNWVRPAAAVAVGTAAGAALLVLRMRHGQRRRTGLRGLAEQSRRELGDAIATARARLP